MELLTLSFCSTLSYIGLIILSRADLSLTRTCWKRFRWSLLSPSGEQRKVRVDVLMVRELVAAEGREAVKRKVSAVLFQWSPMGTELQSILQ